MSDLSDARICDAHCHPTDTMFDIDSKINSMRTSKLTVMSTKFEDIHNVALLAERHREKIIPAFGYHPWFSHLVSIDKDDKVKHYKKVLYPEPTDEFISQLPDPKPFDDYLELMKTYLEKFPYSIVGECGLDKLFRLPDKVNGKLTPYKVTIEHQQAILVAHLKLAGELNRPVSVHGVKCPSVLYDTIMGLNVYPPSICLHSYTASREFLLSSWLKSTKSSPGKPKVFISCSVLINIPNEKKAMDLLEGVPIECVLNESDYHDAGDYMDELNEEAIRRIAKVYGESPGGIALRLSKNYSVFIGET